jgi:general secretion pathway protein L
MTLVITRFPTSERDDPSVFRVAEGVWQEAGALSNFVPTVDDITVMALVAPEDVRCHWLTLPDMQGRQAESVAKLRATEQSLGLVHCSAGSDYDDVVATATIASEVMQFGLDVLKARGLNPDIVLPFALSLSVHSDGISKAEMDGLSVLRGEQFAIPDDAVLRDMFIGDAPIETIDADSIRSMLLSASAAPLLNLREGKFAKRERANWMTAEQKIWVQRLLIALLIVTTILALATLAKYWAATASENGAALAAAQKIDPAIQDIDQAESMLAASLNRQGKTQGDFAQLSAALWRSVKASPNVSIRELRYTPDGILTVVLAAPTSDKLNKALVAIQQDGFRITATPRQDTTGATLVDMTVRMP